MRPTDEQIKQAAEKYLAQLNTGMWENNIKVMEAFAKSLFKETEEETWERTDEMGHPSYFEHAKAYHEERKKIENE